MAVARVTRRRSTVRVGRVSSTSPMKGIAKRPPRGRHTSKKELSCSESVGLSKKSYCARRVATK